MIVLYIQGQIPVHDAGSTLNSCMFSLCCPSCPVKSESYLTRVNSKGNIYSLCELCDLSEAGGEKYPLTYPHSKARTISIAEGLKVLIKS